MIELEKISDGMVFKKRYSYMRTNYEYELELEFPASKHTLISCSRSLLVTSCNFANEGSKMLTIHRII